MGLKTIARHAFEIESTKLYYAANTLVSLVIVASVLTVILETVPELSEQYHAIFFGLELAFFTFFVIEYVLRIYAARNKRDYVLSPMGILDFLCLLPGLALLGPPLSHVAVFWVFRLLRILRLLRTIRLVRFVAPTKRMRERIGRAFSNVNWLNVEIYLFAFILVITFSATLMYFIEGDLPGTHFPTIPDAMWWSIVTITTVGYGDLVPQTVLGKLIASGTMLSGLALFALMLVVVGDVMQKLLFGTRVR